MSVRSGDSFAVQLDENATAGYQWALDPALPPSLVKASEEHRPAQGDAIGAGGAAIFTFDAAAGARGSGTLRFTYKRPWEPQPLKTYALNVSVSP